MLNRLAHTFGFRFRRASSPPPDGMPAASAAYRRWTFSAAEDRRPARPRGVATRGRDRT